MASRGEITVLYNGVTEKAPADELDVLNQANAVYAALQELGFKVSAYPFPDNAEAVFDILERTKPELVFNLVEAVAGNCKLSYVAPSIMEAIGIKYTGCSSEALLLTTNKVVTKKILKACGIATPEWITVHEACSFVKGEKFIIKPVYEDGSVDLSQSSIVNIESVGRIREILAIMKKKAGKEFFAERYIQGREICIPLLGRNYTPEVLPPSEIKFTGYKEKNYEEILDYRAKWEQGSFEYDNAVPTCSFDSKDEELIELLKHISEKSWWEFGLKGYARIDFRIDCEGRPWVLEINGNPCITPGESGFLNSAKLRGLDYLAVVERIAAEV